MSGERRGDEERIEGTEDGRREREEGEKLRCKWCGSPHLMRYGKSHGKRQVYFCKVCGRRFVPRPDGFEKMREDPDVVALALDLYFSGLSLRKVAKHLREVHYKPVSHVAVYKWAKNFVKLISEFVYELKPELCGTWYADEMSLKVRRRWAWLWNVMDRDTRFLLASIVTSERETEDAIKALKQALRQAKERPKVIVTDGLPAYEEAVKKLFWSRYKEKRVVHEKHVRLDGDLTTNLIERLQGTEREREKVLRGVKKEDSVIVEGFRIAYNFTRPHQALDYKTPAEVAGIDYFGKGTEAWVKLMVESARWQKLNEGQRSDQGDHHAS